METRQTIYSCDSCGKEVESKRELRRIQIVPHEPRGYDYDRVVRPELCETCEEKLLAALAKFVAQRPAWVELVKGYARAK